MAKAAEADLRRDVRKQYSIDRAEAVRVSGKDDPLRAKIERRRSMLMRCQEILAAIDGTQSSSFDGENPRFI